MDEFRIWIVPVTTGPGQRLFEDLPGTRLMLAGTRTFDTGVVLLTYVPAGTAIPASTAVCTRRADRPVR